MTLAHEVGISPKHLSFVENGRSNPSRGLLLRICDALAAGPRERNEMLLAAGFAPAFNDKPLDSADMAEARTALSLILRSAEPFGAVAFDRNWNAVMANGSYLAWVASIWPSEARSLTLLEGLGINLPQLLFEHPAMRDRIRNWQQVASWLTLRLRREAGPGSESLLRAVERFGATASPPVAPPDPFMPLELVFDGEVARIVNTISVLGSASDVSLRELRIEMFHPVDESSRLIVEGWRSRNLIP